MEWLWLVLAGAQVQNVVLPQGSLEPLRIACPVDRTTRIVFPEALRQIKGPGPDGPMVLRVERTGPEAVLAVRPTVHPVSAVAEFHGATLLVRLHLESTPAGDGGEIRLSRPTPPPPAPTPEPTPRPPVTPPPSPSPAPKPTSPATLDLEGILRAKVVAVGRREGLPGQPPMVLVDALRNERWVWLRFSLESGARSRVARVSWEGGEVATYTQEASGKDLKVVVQLPREVVSNRAHLSLGIDGGPSYTFALGARWLARFLKDDP